MKLSGNIIYPLIQVSIAKNFNIYLYPDFEYSHYMLRFYLKIKKCTNFQ